MVTEPIEAATPEAETSELGLVPVSENSKTGLAPKSDQIQHIDIDSVKPSPENDILYKPVDPEDPEIIKLSKSIWCEGVLNPIVYTADGYIESGHRRHCAARLAGLVEIPAILSDIRRGDDLEAFTARLAEHNRQRKKSFDEEVREELARQNSESAYQTLIEEREKTSCTIEAFTIEGRKVRSSISAAKMPFLKAVIDAIRERQDYLPLSVRQIHYALLNDPPLKHAKKPDSIYQNDKQSYKSLTDLVARARLDGSISMNSIADPTRPVSCWNTYDGPQTFVEAQFQQFMSGYWRDLMQSQPDHIEILAEKNTIQSIVNRIAMRYCIPTVTGRGYCSLIPRYEMAERYRRSGKGKLIVLIVSDFDPDGEEIAQSFARSMRDDFGIDSIHPIKVALTTDQVEEYSLQPNMEAKRSSAQYKKFVSKYGKNVFEVEALKPEQLEEILKEAIDNVIDIDLFNRELGQEEEDANKIIAFKKVVRKSMMGKTNLVN